MLCLYIRLFMPFQVYKCTQPGRCAFWYIFQNWRQLPQLARAYYTHFIQRCQKRFKAVLFCRLISLHRHNKTAAQGKSQSYKVKTSTNRSQQSLYMVLYPAKVFHQFFKANLNKIEVEFWEKFFTDF